MRNLTFKAAMLNDSRTTVNRRSTDGQSQRHYKQTPLSKRWKVLMTLVFLFTLGIGQMWAADVAFTAGSSTAIAKKVSTSSPLLYMVRGGGGATYTTDYGIQLKTDLIFVFTLDAAADVRINLKSKDTNNAGRDNKFKLYSLNSKKAGFLKILEYSATNNAKLDASYGALKASDSDVTDFSSTSISNANYCSIDNNPAVNSIIGSELTIHTDKNSPADGTFSSVAAGTYVLFCSAAPTTNVCIASITFTSSAATAPAITAPTTDQSAVYTVGDAITALSVTATGTPTPTYQWYYNSSASTEGATSLGSGAQTASYTPSNAAVSDLYYYCIATNSKGSAQSPYFHVEVNAAVATAPSFTSPASEPAVAEYSVGDAISALEVVAAGYPAPTLQWYSNSSKSTEGATLITGAESASYTPSNAAVSDLYFYCVATNASGTAQSEYFHVTVAPVSYCAELVPATSGDAPAAGDAISLTTATGGSIKALTANLSYDANGLLFGNNSSTKAEVTLTHLMKVGTVITATIYNANDDKARGLTLLNGSGTSKATWTKTMVGEHVEKYTVVAGDGLAGTNVFQLQRNQNAYLKSIAVSNCGDELFELSSAIDPVHDPAYATVTLSKTLLAAGGTATATYSAIDPAYDFDEWQISGTGATLSSTTANPTTITMGSTDAVVTLKLKAASVKHTVTYYDGEAILANKLGEEKITEGGNPTGAGLAPKKRGFTFGGWSTTNGGTAIADYAAVTVNEDKNLFVVWTPVACPANGTVFAFEMNNSAKPGAEVKAPANGTLVVDEYLTESGFGSAIIGNTASNQYASVKTTPNITLGGQTGYLNLALECALQAGDIITIAKNNTQIHISDEAGTSGPTGNKYTTASNSENVIIVGANATTAAWVGAMDLYFWYKGGGVNITGVSVVRPAKHTLAWNFDGGNTTSTTHTAAGQVVEGAAITYPANNTMSKDGYTFSGWSTDVTEMPTSDLTITALWTAWPTMTLNRGAATSGDDVVTSVEPGSVVTVPACPFSYTDYNFNGWAYSPAVTMVDETHFTMPSENLTLTAQWVDANNVAQIGSTKYATFAEAAAAVADGETIQLLQDCDYDATWTITGMAVTLDLNGKNLTGPASGDAVAITTDGVLTIMDGTATVDPSINGSNEITYAAGKFTGEWLINVYAGGSFVMNSGWLLAGEAAAWVTNSGIVTVNNGVLEALTNAVVMGPGNAGKGGYTMNIHGGILLGHMSASGIANGYSSMAVYHPNTGTLNIDGGTLISENGPGVVVRGGASNITGGTIIAQGNGGGKCGDANAPLIGEVGVAYDFKANYPGVSSVAATISGTANVSGADGAVQAIYAATEPTATEEAAVAISGGTFSSPVAEALCADDYYPATKPSGKYGVTYAALSVNFAEEAAKTEGQKAWTTFLTDNHYDYNLGDGGEISWDKANAYDTGLKLKKSINNAIYFTTEPGKLIELTVGNIAGMTIQINGGATQTITGGTNNDNLGVSYYYSDNAQSVVLKETSGNSGYNMLKSINIRDPYTVSFDANGGDAVASLKATPAINLPSATNGTQNFAGWYDALDNFIGSAGAPYTPTANIELVARWEALSTVNTLSDLQVDGVTVDGFASDVHTYYIVVPYGTAVADLPKITTATPTNANATVNIYPAAGPEWTDDFGGCYRQQANVTPQDPAAAIGYNDIRITIAPKDPLCIIKAEHDGTATGATVTGFYGGTKDKKTANNGKLGEANQYFGIKLAEEAGTFKAGDVLKIYATNPSAAVRIYSDKGTTRINAEDGTFDSEKMFTYTLTGDEEWIYLYRRYKETETDMNPTLGYMAVYRPVPNPLVKTITFNGAAGAVDNTASPKTITVEVPASTDVATMPVVATFYSNDPSQTSGAVTGGTWAEGTNEYIVTDKDNDQTVYTVTITKAVPSSDATLSALSYGTPATAIALADGVYEYDVLLPYGTSDVPALAATAHHAGATIESIDNATAFVDRKATSTVTVKAEDNATTQVYTVNFTVDRYETTVLWDASVNDNLSQLTGCTTAGISVSDADDVEFEGKTYGKKALSFGGKTKNDRYLGIQIPNGKVAKVSIVYKSRGTSARSIMLATALASAIDEQTIVSATAETQDLARMTADIFAAGTIYINTTNGYQVFEINVQLADGYGRSAMLGAGVYGTICVPNNVAVEDIQGVTVYELMGRESQYGKLAFDEIISGELEAGVPYVFQAHRNHMALLYGEDNVADPVDKHNGMYGTFTDKVLTELNDVYYFAQKALWGCADLASLNVPANRAYVKLSEVGSVASSVPAPGRRRISMAVNGEQVATGIENTGFESEAPRKVLINGELYIIRGEKMYDAKGQLVK